MVRVISTALCCASGDSEITRSKDVVLEVVEGLRPVAARSMPISSIAATAKGSGSPGAHADANRRRCACRAACFSIASAIGERIAFWVQAKRTLRGQPRHALTRGCAARRSA